MVALCDFVSQQITTVSATRQLCYQKARPCHYEGKTGTNDNIHFTEEEWTVRFSLNKCCKIMYGKELDRKILYFSHFSQENSVENLEKDRQRDHG